MKHWRPPSLTFRDLQPDDVAALALQSSQCGRLGIFEPVRDAKRGAELRDAGPAWAAIGPCGGVLCLAGFAEVFPGRQAIAWALLSERLRIEAHLALLPFMRERLAEQPHRRIEAIARAASRQELNWLRRLGFVPEGVMRSWGPLSEDHVLFRYERGADRGRNPQQRELG